MSKKKNLSTLLVITDSLSEQYDRGLKNYKNFFATKQGSFLGEKKTYDPNPDTVDVPSNRGNIKVVTTVQEKFDYLAETSKDFIDALFSQEWFFCELDIIEVILPRRMRGRQH